VLYSSFPPKPPADACLALAEDARARADWALLKVSMLQEEFLQEKLRLRVSPNEGLQELRACLRETREALAAVKSSAVRLEEFVEGCTALDTACGATGSHWNLCVFKSDDSPGVHGVGTGAKLR